jgi:hypothetical protein
MKKIFETIKNFFLKKIFREETGGILNYVTLQISDREVA